MLTKKIFTTLCVWLPVISCVHVQYNNVYVSLSECQNGGQLLDCSVMSVRIANRWSTWIFLDLPCTFTW